MRGVEHHRRAERRHDRQRPHVGDQRVVTEGSAALGHQHIGIAGAGDLGDDVLHVPGREELALLDVDDACRYGRRRRAGRSGGTGRPGSAARPRPGRQRAHCSRSWTSVSTGSPGFRGFRRRSAAPLRAPARGWPSWGAVGLVEAGLVDRGRRRPAAAISFRAAAISSAWARLSSWHGPAMRASGSLLPKRAAPTATTGLGARRDWSVMTAL